DFTDHDDAVRLRVSREHLDDVQMRSAVDWIATDADACGLSHSSAGQLPYGFVRQSSAARYDPYVSSLGHVTRRTPNAAPAVGVLALARRNSARAIRTDKPRRFAFQGTFHFHHVINRNSFGDAHDLVQA